MLAAMSSFALAHTAAPAFNGLYYATVATIIPVLFLALAIQGNDYEELVKRGAVTTKRARDFNIAIRNARLAARHEGRPVPLDVPPGIPPDWPRRPWAQFRAMWAGPVVLVIAMFIIFCGGCGEVEAIYVLSDQQPSSYAHTLVQLAAVSLTVAVIVRPSAVLGKVLLTAFREAWPSLRHPLTPTVPDDRRQKPGVTGAITLTADTEPKNAPGDGAS
jgi:hypothetical protein